METSKPDLKTEFHNSRSSRVWKLEVFLIIISVALSAMLLLADGYQVIVLNLFFLPVVLAGFFLGRYRAGILAFFCVISAAIVVCSDFQRFAAFDSPFIIALAVTIWGSTLGLTTLLVGSLCDELSRKMVEAQEAHIGVVEVLSQYLQSANPKLQNKATRVSRMADAVAKQLKLSQTEIDNVRLASLLVEVENIEVTARVIKKAVGQLGSTSETSQLQRTFNGTDLVLSLGEVLSGVVPLLLEQDKVREHEASIDGDDIQIGTEIIRAVRSYDSLLNEPWSVAETSLQAIEEMRNDLDSHFHPAVLFALETQVRRQQGAANEPTEFTTLA